MKEQWEYTLVQVDFRWIRRSNVIKYSIMHSLLVVNCIQSQYAYIYACYHLSTVSYIWYSVHTMFNVIKHSIMHSMLVVNSTQSLYIPHICLQLLSLITCKLYMVCSTYHVQCKNVKYYALTVSCKKHSITIYTSYMHAITYQL